MLESQVVFIRKYANSLGWGKSPKIAKKFKFGQKIENFGIFNPFWTP